MRIQRLRLTGFKSFVEPTELAIERGLTGIVGPNGCGKSNLLEAIRWVMGESSARSMRGGGMDDVIFAGTETRPSRDFAEVTLIGHSEGAALPGVIAGDEGGELEVVRRIERGAGSAYRVNGRDVRARDVALVFADAATGAHSPALVSQGKVAAVIAAKPQERRQLLEEAAGIAGLHARRKEAEQKLRATEANLTRLAEHLADMEARAGQLRRQARAAERYTRLSDQIRIAEARMIFARWRDAAAAADSARTETASAEAAVGQAQGAQAEALAAQTAAAAAYATARDAVTSARTDEQGASAELGTRRAERDALVRRQADLTAEAARIADEQAAEDALGIEAAAAIARSEALVATAATALAAHEAERTPIQTALGQASERQRDADVAFAQAQAAAANDSAERRIADSAWRAAEARVARFEEDRARIDRDEAALDPEDALATEAEAARAAHDGCRDALVAIETAIADADAAREAASARLAEAETARVEARTALAALESEAAAIERSLAASPDAADSLLAAIRVEPGYEAALAAALGDDLAAPLASGDARFGWAGAVPDTADPAAPAHGRLLASVVSAPDALARRLAQIIVVKRDDGMALAVGQRLVTLGGRLRRWDGFIADSTGAAAAERLARRNRRDAIIQQLPQVGAGLAAIEAAHGEARDGVGRAEGALRDARDARRGAEEGLRTAAREIDRIEAAQERRRAFAAQIVDRRTRLTAEADEANAALDLAAARMAALPDSHVATTALAEAEASAAAARQAHGTAREALATLDAAVAATREQQIEAQADIRGWRARAGEAARRIAAMAARSDAIEEERALAKGAPERLDARIAEIEGARGAAQQRLAGAIEAERETAAQAATADAEIERARETLSAAREHRAGAAARAEAADARRIEMGRIAGERFSCPPPLLPGVAGFDAATVMAPADEGAAHERLTQERERIGPVNLVAAQELAEIESAQATSASDAEELTQAVHRLRGSIGHLNREGRQRLLEAFGAVDRHFRSLFTSLFGGGEAHLELVESDDPLEAGLEIMAQPPGKKLTSLTLLSGGEQALTAVALIFALFLTNPAPICVLDEVDAPLDDANVERFCDLLDRMTRDTATRYLIVTHNAVTMSRMHRLFGVTMVERGVSRLVSVDLGGAEQLLAAE